MEALWLVLQAVRQEEVDNAGHQSHLRLEKNTLKLENRQLFRYLGEDVHELHHSHVPRTARDVVWFWENKKKITFQDTICKSGVH